MLMLYAIPDFSAVREPDGRPSQMVHAKPLVVYKEGVSDPAEVTAISNALCPHHEGRQSVAGETGDDRSSLLIVLPQAGAPLGAEFIRRPIRLCDMGPRYATTHPLHLRAFLDETLVYSRAVWIEFRTQFEDPVELRSCAHATKLDSHMGYMRLGRVDAKAPDPARVVSIPIVGHNEMRMESLSWDEESGRICLFRLDREAGNTQNLLVVDLL